LWREVMKKQNKKNYWGRELRGLVEPRIGSI
jgi:hypothetical protein